MTVGSDGAESRQREGTTFDARLHLPPRRSRLMPWAIGIVALLLIVGGIYLYADSDNDITGNNEPNQAAANQPAPPAQPLATPTPSAAQRPSASQPAPEPAPAPERSAAQPAPSQTAQAPAPVARPAAPPQPMQQQSTNLPEDSDMRAVRVESANVRSAPSLRARVVVTAHRGTKLKVLGRSGKWVRVEADGRNGWINGKMLGAQ